MINIMIYISLSRAFDPFLLMATHDGPVVAPLMKRTRDHEAALKTANDMVDSFSLHLTKSADMKLTFAEEDAARSAVRST